MGQNILLDPLTGLPKKPGQSQAAAPFALDATSPGVAPGDLAGSLYGTNPGAAPAATPQSAASDPASYYQQILSGLLGPLQSQLGAASVSDLAGRNASFNRAVTQFGQAPDTGAAQQALGLNLNDVLDPSTAQAAANNPYSVQAKLAQAHSDAVRQIRRTLAARGGLQSGDLGFQLNREQQAFGGSQYDATQKLLDYLAGVQQAYLQSEQQRQQQLQQQQMQQAQLLAQTYQGGGAPQDNSGGGGYDYTPSDTVYPGPSAGGDPLEQIKNEMGFYSPGDNGTSQQRQSAQSALAQLAAALAPPKSNAYNTNANKRG